jgi:hypothetical protein
LWNPLFAIPDTEWHSLDVQDDASALLAPFGWPNVVDHSKDIRDFKDSAAIVESCDLVITVDTATLHLAGALGIPTWALVYSPPEWRWGLSGERTPWYAALHLYRQPRPDDWESVFKIIAFDLRCLTAHPSMVGDPLRVLPRGGVSGCRAAAITEHI